MRAIVPLTHARLATPSDQSAAHPSIRNISSTRFFFLICKYLQLPVSPFRIQLMPNPFAPSRVSNLIGNSPPKSATHQKPFSEESTRETLPPVPSVPSVLCLPAVSSAPTPRSPSLPSRALVHRSLARRWIARHPGFLSLSETVETTPNSLGSPRFGMCSPDLHNLDLGSCAPKAFGVGSSAPPDHAHQLPQS